MFEERQEQKEFFLFLIKLYNKKGLRSYVTQLHKPILSRTTIRTHD
jgi:hypothetical protein